MSCSSCKQGPQTYFSRDEIQRVFVIGAGCAGLAAAVRLISDFAKLGKSLSLHIIEKRASFGGVWLGNPVATEDCNFDFQIPNYHLPPTVELEKCENTGLYPHLRTNIVSSTMQFMNLELPAGTGNFPHNSAITSYIRKYFEQNQIPESCFVFNTTVTSVYKRDNKWVLVLKSADSVRSEIADAVVFANGHHNAPKIPFIEGFEELAKASPERLIHSRDFTDPEAFRDKSVLLVGDGFSARDICSSIHNLVSRLYRSIRTKPDVYLPLPSPVTSFHPNIAQITSENVVFADGTKISIPDVIFFCTGYHYSFAFLRDIQLTTDGEYVQHVFKQLFYIPDPTLAVMGLQFLATPFNFFEFQALWISRVWNGLASLPCKECMQKQEALDPRDRSRHALQIDGQINYTNMVLSECSKSEVEHELNPLPDWWIELRKNTLSIKYKELGY